MYTGTTTKLSHPHDATALRPPGALVAHTVATRSPPAANDMTQANHIALDQVLAGDNAAIADFVATMTPVIQARVARCLLKGTPRDIRHDTEDHCQDVYAHLFADSAKILKNFDTTHGLSLRNYVGLVAERRVIDLLRSSKSNPWRENTSLEGDALLMCGNGSPEREATGQSALGALFDLLRSTLSPFAWRLFQLLYVHELSVGEVSTQTGLSSDAVYAWRSRLRKAARDAQHTLNARAPNR